MTGHHPTVAQLCEASQEAFDRIVSDHIAPDDLSSPGEPDLERQALWEALTQPPIIGRTLQTLNTLIMDMESQLATGKAQHEAFLQECFRDGPEGKGRWFARKGEYDDWRRRILVFRQFVQQRQTKVKKIRRQQLDANPALRAAARYGTAPNPAKHKHNLDALFRLAYAVAVHRDGTAEEGLLPTPQDVELWDALEKITLIVGVDEEKRLSDWLDNLTSRPEFNPPQYRTAAPEMYDQEENS